MKNSDKCLCEFCGNLRSFGCNMGCKTPTPEHDYCPQFINKQFYYSERRKDSIIGMNWLRR